MAQGLTDITGMHKQQTDLLERSISPAPAVPGWECPRCHRVNSPLVGVCGCQPSSYVAERYIAAEHVQGIASEHNPESSL